MNQNDGKVKLAEATKFRKQREKTEDEGDFILTKLKYAHVIPWPEYNRERLGSSEQVQISSHCNYKGGDGQFLQI